LATCTLGEFTPWSFCMKSIFWLPVGRSVVSMTNAPSAPIVMPSLQKVSVGPK
jgi:hypothetical protein